jgi:hypothetical protein
MNERRTFGLLLMIVAICTLATPLQASPQSPKPNTVRIRVDSVLAANTGKGMDAQLASTKMGDRLKALFEYTTYRLVMRQERQTVCGRVVTFTMPGGRILHLALRSIEGNMISMELVLFEGTRPVMTTDLKLVNHAILIVGGPRYQQGMLITMISTDAPDRPRDRGALPEAPSAPSLSPASPGAGTIPAGSASAPQN